jgi:hypothetical protein
LFCNQPGRTKRIACHAASPRQTRRSGKLVDRRD